MRKRTHEEIANDRLPRQLLSDTPRTPVVGLLDNIRSLYNVGSIFRTADGAFIQGLYLCGFTPTPPRKEILKTALGATESVPWKYIADPLEAVADARKQGLNVCVLEQTTDSRPYHSLRKSDFPLCLVVGNELTGVSPEIVSAADIAIDIPMHGMKQSLNAAVAFGIAVFDLVRVWHTR